ncbi:MAG: HDOD domain-containing protein [Limisphaerales bacterium]
MPQITEAVKRITALAPTPEMFPLLTRLMRDPAGDIEEVAAIARHDMALTATLLQRANSATRRGAEPVESVDEAILRLGMHAVLEIVLTLVSQSLYQIPPEARIHLHGLWEHTLLTGVLTRDLTRKTDIPRSTAYTAGLLHDIGKVFLMKADPAEYTRTLQKARIQHRPCVDQEVADFGIHHGNVGGEMLARWKIPPTIAAAVGAHHHTDTLTDDSALARAVETADTLAYVAGFGLGDQYTRCPNAFRNLDEFELKPIDLPEILANALREVEQVRQTLRSRD